MAERKTQAEVREKAFVLPPRVLDLLGGTLKDVRLPERQVTMVDEGAFLWGVDPLILGKGIFNHSLLVGRLCGRLSRALIEKSREKSDGFYTKDKLRRETAIEAGVCHDAVKLRFGKAYLAKIALGIEDLTENEKIHLGYSAGIKEISPKADDELAGWMEERNFPFEVIQTIIGHDFPEDSKAAETIYQKIVLLADYAAGQEVSLVRSRLNDVFDRWLVKSANNADQFSGEEPVDIVRNHWQELEFDQPPRIEPERAAKAAEVIEGVAEELFGYLGITEEEFLEANKAYFDPNLEKEDKKRPAKDRLMEPWERVLRKAWEKDYQFQDKGGAGAPRADQVKTIVAKRTN